MIKLLEASIPWLSREFGAINSLFKFVLFPVAPSLAHSFVCLLTLVYQVPEIEIIQLKTETSWWHRWRIPWRKTEKPAAAPKLWTKGKPWKLTDLVQTYPAWQSLLCCDLQITGQKKSWNLLVKSHDEKGFRENLTQTNDFFDMTKGQHSKRQLH